MSLFTRRHYKAIASTIKNYNVDFNPAVPQPLLEEVIADLFADDNENFDREKFLEACGLER